MAKHIKLLALTFFAVFGLSACTPSSGIDDQPSRETTVLLSEALQNQGIDAIRDAALDGEPEATRILASCYSLAARECGFDLDAARDYLERAIELGSIRAKSDLCYLRLKSLPDRAGQDDAIALCRQAHQEGDPSAGVILAEFAMAGQPEAARVVGDVKPFLQTRIEEGDYMAARTMALGLRRKLLGESEPELVMQSINLAIAMGSQTALFDRAWQVSQENRPENQTVEAIEAVAASPIARFPEIQAWMGRILLESNQEQKGWTLLEEAASTRHPVAMSLLAYSIELEGKSQRGGFDVEQLFQQAADKNEVFALQKLASKAANANNYEEAIPLAKRAARSSDPGASEFFKDLENRQKAYAQAQKRQREAQQRMAALFSQRENASSGTPRIPANASYADKNCTRTGYGPGNTVSCGRYSDRCEKTGFGPGNHVACGGLATRCEKTGFGPGNDIACGGLSDRCEKTGFGPGNRVSCGGLSSRCEKTGFGKGNDVSCGGKSDRCEKTGFGPGNDVSCGGLATRCEKTGYGRGNREACGGLARRR